MGGLEELLSKLIDAGWKPFGVFDKLMGYGQSNSRKVFQFGVLGEYEYYLRDMVSIESGLWQFVCENELITLKFGDRRHYNTDNDRDKICLDCNYPYWLIESALCNEDKLEDFLLQSIVINND